MARWNEDTTLKFVCEYLSHECLWNCKNELYLNKQARQAAYNSIENTMKIPGFGEKEIKTKFKNIRSTYSQELKKIRDSKKPDAPSEVVYIPSVKWFHILNESLQKLSSDGTRNESNTPRRDSRDEENIESPIDREFREPNSPTKKQKRSHFMSIVKQLKGKSGTNNSLVEENEFDVFGRHVGVQLKTLPMLLALEAQEHIQLYLNKIRRRHIENCFRQNSETGASTSSYYASQTSPYFTNSTITIESSDDNSPSTQITSQPIVKEEKMEYFVSDILDGYHDTK